MARPDTSFLEFRQRAVRMVYYAREANASQWAAIEAVAGKIGCTPKS